MCVCVVLMCVYMRVCVYARVCVVCVSVCVSVLPMLQPPCGGHGKASLACLVMWLMVAPLILVLWWRSGRAKSPRIGLASHPWRYIPYHCRSKA